MYYYMFLSDESQLSILLSLASKGSECIEIRKCLENMFKGMRTGMPSVCRLELPLWTYGPIKTLDSVLTGNKVNNIMVPTKICFIFIVNFV